MKKNTIRSPFFYVGDKYKLMPQLKQLFPQKIEVYIEPFVGGGSSFLNTIANKYIVNDVDPYVIALHKCLAKYSKKTNEFLERLYRLIEEYGLSCSYKNITVPNELKKKFVKTYYSRYNKTSYEKLRDSFNEKEDMEVLYLLLIYGFNHMVRFNSCGKFNLPVGNVDFNKNVHDAIVNYMDFMKNHDIEFYNLDFMSFLDKLDLNEHCYIYFDPPYLISGSEYNKHWNEKEELRLYEYLDYLNSKGISFGITNLVSHKGKINTTFLEWSKKYLVYNINSNYISFNDNTIKETSREVFVTNYDNE